MARWRRKVFDRKYSPREERDQLAHVIVTCTTRASKSECDCSNLSAASQASSQTMRRSQT